MRGVVMAAIAPVAAVPARGLPRRASSRASAVPAGGVRLAPPRPQTSSLRDRGVTRYQSSDARRSVRTRRFAAPADAPDAAPDAAPAPARLDLEGDELVLVVGGAGRVGARVVRRLASAGARCRVLTRDPSSEAAAALRDACPPGTVELARGDVTEPGPNGDAALAAACVGCTHVVACFGAQRISKIGDIVGLGAPESNDVTHPAAVNFRGVARLATAAAKAGTVRRLVRVTGMSVGYHPSDPIAVLLNAVLSMTIKWQLRGERAVRACGVPYTVVRPGNLLDTPRPPGSVVLVGHGDAKVPAGKVSRDDVAEVISVATFAKNCQNATVGVAGAPAPTGGISSQMAWDPARGMHYVAVEHEESVREGVDVAAMLEGVKADVGELRERRYFPFVAAFVAMLFGAATLVTAGLVAAARALLKL